APLGLAAAGPAGAAAVGAALAAVWLALGLWARARIGGQTGDILGAGQQLAEAAALGFLAAGA
ncbi:MAG: adenosylcobinamide-GDP ribazoletransferase, partial [Gemmobacter sp.]|uniref:adenosylcobinamide-GDP ribazoletransferase n=1 Tax=Gemmobacter sp. TaxID=1898957 RepID=UPI00391A7274